jgi:hypothetical protein
MVRAEVLKAIGGAEEEFTGQYEDQVLLAKLYLSYPCVISGGRTARYRMHANSSTANALRTGINSDDHPNVSQEAFLRWLSSHTQIQRGTGPGIREIAGLVEQALTPYSGRLAGAGWRGRGRLRRAIPLRLRPVARLVVRSVRALGLARVGYLRRTTPLSRHFGSERGLPIDRYYVERFLTENAHAIDGRVLEIGDASYTHRFGGQRVTRSDVLNVNASDPGTTIVADLTQAEHIPDHTFDCVILTQTLHLIYDLHAAVGTVHRILKPGGTLLATFPGISAISADQWADTWYWSLTPLAASRLFHPPFGSENVEITHHGNVLTSVAFLQGMATHELRPTELNTPDAQFPMLITVRALRPVAT